MNKIIIILSVLISLSPCSAFAQIEADIIRPSVNAEQFGLSVKAEAALNKGQLSLSIPLMTLKGKGYDLPISLTFYSGDVTKGTQDPIAYAFARKFNFKGVKGTAESVNYHSFFTDGTPVWSKNYLKPYPANGGKWTYIHRYKK